MSRYFLKRITAEGFRGINNAGDPLVIKFKPEAVNTIHAPNGLGKSSLFEAIHFAVHNVIPRLESLKDSEQGPSYVVNRFHPGHVATVGLLFSSDDGTPDVELVVTRTASGVRSVTSPSGHTDPEGFLATLKEDFVLVDYARFSSFIDNSPLDRGRSFASLVGLSRYSHLRRSLEGVVHRANVNNDLGLAALEKEVETKELRLAGIGDRILAAYNATTGESLTGLTDVATMIAAATAALSGVALLAPLMGTGSVMDLDFGAAEAMIDSEEGGTARQELQGLHATTALLGPLAVTAQDIDDAARLLDLARRRDEALAAAGKADMLTLLQAALAVVSAPDWSDPQLCPVCAQRAPSALRQELEAQIGLYAAATALGDELIAALDAAPGVAKLKALEQATPLGVPVQDRTSARLTGGQQAVPTTLIAPLADTLKMLEARRQAAADEAAEKARSIEERLPPSLVQLTKLLGFAKQFRDAVKEYQAALPVLDETRSQLAKVQRWYAFITRAEEMFAAAETKLANDRIADVQGASQTLFTKLVRGGPDVKPRLDRSPTSENVDLTLENFFGLHGVSARALLSESYRNAVAASIFLSAAVKQQRAPRFMVLDDVTSSFDAGHQFALMEAMRTDLRFGGALNGIQFIVLSHDASLEKYFDRLNATPDWHHQKLQGVSPTGRLMVSAQEGERLRTQAETYLNAGQVDVGAPFVRQYLEYKLGQIISRLHIPVPPDYATRGDRRTLSTYIDAIVEAVTLYEQAHRCVLTPAQINALKVNHAPAIMANYVSHYETSTGTPFNAYAMLGVLAAMDDFVDCFMYPDPANPAVKRFYQRLDRT